MKRLSDEEKARLKAKVQQEQIKRTHRIVEGDRRKKPIPFLKILPIVIIGTAIAILLLTFMWLITLMWLVTSSIDLIGFNGLIAFVTVPTAIMIAAAILGFYFRKNSRFLKIILTIIGGSRQKSGSFSQLTVG